MASGFVTPTISGGDACLTVAAADSTENGKASADYICDGIDQELIIDDCEVAWNTRQGANVICTADADHQVGTFSAKMAVQAAAVLGLLATHDFVALGLHNHNTLRLWIKHSLGCAAGDLALHLSSVANCGGAPNEEEIALPALGVNTWTQITLTQVNWAIDNAIISVGIELVANDPGAFDLFIDDVKQVWGNDNVEIQLALDALPATGGKVILLDGTFHTNAIIKVPSLVHLQGQGASTIIQPHDDFWVVANFNANSVGTVDSDIRISDLVIDCNNIGWHGIIMNRIAGGGPVAYADRGRRLYIVNVTVYNALWQGLIIENTIRASMIDSVVQCSGKNNFHITYSDQGSFINCKSWYTGDHHFEFSLSNNCNCVGCSGKFAYVANASCCLVRDSSDVNVIGLTSEDNSLAVCLLYTDTAYPLKRINIEGVTSNNDGLGVFGEGAQDIKISGFTAYGGATLGNRGILLQQVNILGTDYYCDRVRIIGNHIEHFEKDGVYLWKVQEFTIADNTILNNNQLGAGHTGIFLGGNGTHPCRLGVISNNVVTDDQGAKTQAYALKIDNGADFLTVTDNYFDANGIGAINLVSIGERCTFENNQGATNVQDKKLTYMKNTSGGALAAGDVVMIKAVAAGDEFTTPGGVGVDNVLGMLVEGINNNGYGYVQILGKTTILKATNAGGGNIAIGDFLCTEVGVRARKAAAGDMAFAIALEACAVADLVIDALIITPRKI